MATTKPMTDIGTSGPTYVSIITNATFKQYEPTNHTVAFNSFSNNYPVNNTNMTSYSDDSSGQGYASRTNTILNETEDLKLATYVVILTGSILALLAVLMVVIVYVRRRSSFQALQEDKESVKSYETIEKVNSRATKRLSSLGLLLPSRKTSKDKEKNNGNVLMMTSDSNPGNCSPMITRSVAHGDIPFILPPSKFKLSSSSTDERIQPPVFQCIGSNNNIRKNMSDLSLDPFDEVSELSDPFPPSSTSDRGNSLSSNDTSFGSADGSLVSPTQYRNSLIGKIQPELYKFSKDEINSLPTSEKGRIWFSIVYDAAVETLTIKDIKVKQLPERPGNLAHDSFVKLFLLPDERISQQTKVKRRTNNPKFNETFVFQVSEEDVRNRTLRFSVYDVDKRKVARHLLGHALVNLGGVDLSQSSELMWRDLSEIAHPGDSGTSLGEIKLSLSYLPSMERLTAVVLRMRNLRKIDLEATGVYVKVTLAQGHNVIRSKKTAVQRGVCDPNYNESFAFTVTAKELEQSCLKINVVTVGCYSGFRQITSSVKNMVSSGKTTREHKYGRVVVGSHMYCRGEQLLHWQEMVAEPRKSIGKWHPLSEVPLE